MTQTSLHGSPDCSGGILLVNKQKNTTSFSLVGTLRRLLNVKKIGHAGTLDPFATGVMVMLIGKEFTKKSNSFLDADKEYIATAYLGVETDSYDCDGQEVSRNDLVPSLDEIMQALKLFQGEILQTPPMFSAKKKNGKKLYELARQGITIPREPVRIQVKTHLIDFTYPYLKFRVECSKGTYIRSIAQDLGKILGCGAHLSDLQRVRSGSFHIDSCIDGAALKDPNCDIESLKKRLLSCQ
ncbi:MAG: tRNA pseudouridine(55) synthase TruB [Parachlamydiaceae bacterium]